MRGRQDNVAVIVVVVRSSPTSTVRSVYASPRPVDSLLPTLEARGGRVQDGLLHDDGDEAIFVVPHHISSVAASLFVAHHPRHHHPCRPHPHFHHHCRRSLATLVTVAIALAALFVAALIIGHALLLFVVTRCRARVHRPPSTLPSLVD